MTRACSALLFAAVCSLALGACKQTTDAGSPCMMTQPCSSGTAGCVNNQLPLTRDQLSSRNLDYIALGSASCDDLVCLRSGNPEPEVDTCSEDGDCASNAGYIDGLVCDKNSAQCSRYNDTCPSTDPCAEKDKYAMGYCTHACITDDDCNNDYQGKPGMTCKQVLLSNADQVIGPNASSHYCVEPRRLQNTQ